MKKLFSIIAFFVSVCSFAQNVKISEMTAATDLNTAFIPIIQGGLNKKAASTLFGTSAIAPLNFNSGVISFSGWPANSSGVLTNNGSGVLSWATPVSQFQLLTDGPGVFTSHGLNYTRVNSGATALEYRTTSQVLSDISGVPTSRVLTINGIAMDLTADRTWTISTATNLSSLTDANIVTPTNNQFLQYQTSDNKWHNHTLVAGDIPTLNQNTTGSSGSVLNSVTFNNSGTGAASGTTFNGSSAQTISYNTVGAAPASRLISTNAPLSGGGDLSADRTLSISQATTSTNGYLSSTDWNTFNNKQSTGLSWLLGSGGTLTGANTITGSSSNTLQFVFNALGSTQTNGAGIWLQNSTAAASGLQQISPSTVWEGQGWKTQATAASQSVKFASWVTPVQGLIAPTGNWELFSSINGGSYTSRVKVNSGGNVTIPGSIIAGPSINLSLGDAIQTNLIPLTLSSASQALNLNASSETGSISIGNNASTLNLSGSINSNFKWDDAAVNSGTLTIGVFGDGFNLTTYSSPGFSGNSLNIDASSGTFFITDASNNGFQYAATGYVTQLHSLTDKEYVDAHLKGYTFTNSPLTNQVANYNGTNWTFSSVTNAMIANSTIDLTAKVTGILPVANGGTGTTTPGIVAGSNITVSGTWPNQTVSASGAATPWSLASGGTLTGANTITSNTANQLLFNGTWTATANNQNHIQLGGTITSENVASDNLNYFVLNPTIARNAGNPATQTATAVLINPSFINSPATNYILRMQSGGTDIASFNTDAIYTSGKLSIGSSLGSSGLNLIYGSANGSDINGYLGTTQQFSFGFNNLAIFEGTSGVSSGRNLYFYDRVSNGYIAAFSQNYLTIGASFSNYAIRAARVTGKGIDIISSGLVGINQPTPTAYLHLTGSTTSTASFRIASGTAPTSPNQGDFWNDGTNLFFYSSSQKNAVASNFSIAAPATTGTMTTTLTNVSTVTITPTGSCTFNASGGIAGSDCTFVITTSGTSAFTLTWGTNFKSTGTLSTGTVTAKVFTVSFRYDGTNWNETARTTAM